MIPYKITSYDLKGSIKPQAHGGKMQDIELPDGAIPIGFDTIIKDVTTKGELFDWAFYPTVKVSESWQREWLDNEHTEFVCVIDGVLKRYQVITRVYCMIPKAAGVAGLSPNPDKLTAVKNTVLEKSLNLVWTDGGNAGCEAYFDGAGEFSNTLMKLFSYGSANHVDGRRGVPFSTNIMEDISLGSKVKCTIRLEIDEKKWGTDSPPEEKLKNTASETLVSTDGKTVHEEKRIICKRMNWKRASDCNNSECDDYQSCLREVDSSEQMLSAVLPKNKTVGDAFHSVHLNREETMGTPDMTKEKIWNPTHQSLGEKVFPLLNEGFNVFIEKGNDERCVRIRPFRKEEKCQK